VNADQRARSIERAALRAANQAMERNPGASLSREDLLGLRIQAAPLGARIILAVLGLAAFGADLGLGVGQSAPWLALILLIAGFLSSSLV
jgi:hypothetical protein